MKALKALDKCGVIAGYKYLWYIQDDGDYFHILLCVILTWKLLYVNITDALTSSQYTFLKQL